MGIVDKVVPGPNTASSFPNCAFSEYSEGKIFFSSIVTGRSVLKKEVCFKIMIRVHIGLELRSEGIFDLFFHILCQNYRKRVEKLLFWN